MVTKTSVRRVLMCLGVLIVLPGCIPTLVNGLARAPNKEVPAHFENTDGGTTAAQIPWETFFADEELRSLIEGALKRNQEYNILALEVEVAQSEVLARRGELFPKLGIKAGVGVGRNGGLTSSGVSDAAHGVPDHLGEFGLGLTASWEVDIWGKLRNASKAAVSRYLASIEGQKFAATTLIAEVANTYYELRALEAQLELLRENISLQQDALAVVRLQKEAAKVTELAVKRFEAEVMKNQSRQFALEQERVVVANRLHFLLGRFPSEMSKGSSDFVSLVPTDVPPGLPSQLLLNRPDIRQAELSLAATDFDVKSARAAFFPTLGISVEGGYQAFDLLKLFATPLSLFYHVGADVMAPLLNRTALTSSYFAANAKQKQAVLNYERAILKGYIEAANQIAAIENVGKGYSLRLREVELLKESAQISGTLFSSARADYMEVLTTRRDALESQMELIELKERRLKAMVDLYQALGGGWKELQKPAEQKAKK